VDASTYAFAGERDGVFTFRSHVFSRADRGVREPAPALRPGGGLTFVCFRDRELNTWWTVPVAAASTVVAPPSRESGPSRWGEEGYIRTILEAARFADIACA
jgi:hypothetical protein